MNAKKEVRLNIRSVIDDLDPSGLQAGEPEINDTSAKGFIRSEGEIKVISYTENSEGGSVRTELSVLPDGSVTLKREGAICSLIIFREGEEHRSVYSVPPYSFDMTVVPKRIRASLSDEGGEVRLMYLMNIGGGARQVRMTFTAKAES